MPAPPWQPEELQKLCPRKVGSAALAVADKHKKKKILLMAERCANNPVLHRVLNLLVPAFSMSDALR